jgi:predicted RNA-binding Zn-ribbon protein involved in translation (DUF1610 family)
MHHGRAGAAQADPMSQPSDPDRMFERSSFIKTCGYCGARLAVFVSREVGSDEQHDYECPECGKDYTVHAALEPLLSVLEPRTDGKDDRYAETLF